jgi:hypothetical protein
MKVTKLITAPKASQNVGIELQLSTYETQTLHRLLTHLVQNQLFGFSSADNDLCREILGRVNCCDEVRTVEG